MSLEIVPDTTLDDLEFEVDAHRVTQILTNFAWNSIEFSAASTVTFRVRSQQVAGRPDQRVLFFDVADNGCGMDATAQARLQTGGVRQTGTDGSSGLGLRICNALAEMLPYLRDKDIGVINASPLAMGLLTPQVR